jgi:hypothetical protein
MAGQTSGVSEYNQGNYSLAKECLVRLDLSSAIEESGPNS